MQLEEFVGTVQNRARLDSQGAAMSAISATLQTLGERLHGEEAENLGAQLPSALADYLTMSDQKETYDLQEFFRRVAEREGPGVDLPDAVHHARVVIEVLLEAVSGGQIADARAQFPDSFEALFEAGSQGTMTVDKD
jgi:uncharacterized protein (DUF2267 family)